MRSCIRPFLLALVTLSGACATSPSITVPDVPDALRPPAGQKVFLEALATGVQIYECAPKSTQPDAFEWAFRAPEAKLADRAGKTLGQHYAGPTWQATDGSKVVGEVKARDPGPNASAIPWLLLNAKSTSGNGALTRTASIQRLQTTGGLAPTLPCDASSVKQMARVPYTATYYFYRAE
jgi:hypothetical protein